MFTVIILEKLFFLVDFKEYNRKIQTKNYKILITYCISLEQRIFILIVR